MTRNHDLAFRFGTPIYVYDLDRATELITAIASGVQVQTVSQLQARGTAAGEGSRFSHGQHEG
jgi:hypothetical protein